MVNKFSTIKERVVQLIETKGIAKEYFFGKIGITSANFRGDAAKTPLNSTAIENIFTEFPDLSLEWLITGRGEMLRENTNQIVQDSTNTQENIQPQITKNQHKDTKIKNENKDISENILACPLCEEKERIITAMDGIIESQKQTIKAQELAIESQKETISALKNESDWDVEGVASADAG